MANIATAPTCHLCGAAVAKEDLFLGLSVRVDGAVVCPMCVEALPGEAQVRINQIRALRGLATTTYQVPNPRHPGLHAYTFTSSVNISTHRHALAGHGIFETPVLARGAQPPPAVPASPTPPSSPMALGVVIASALGMGLLLLIILGRVLHSTTPPRAVVAASSSPVRIPGAGTPPRHQRIHDRSYYPSGPLAAWRSAAADSACPPAVLDGIAHELVDLRSHQLDAAGAALARGDDALANHWLDAMTMPAHIYFKALRDREREMRLHPHGPGHGSPPPLVARTTPLPTVASPATTPPPAPVGPPAPRTASPVPGRPSHQVPVSGSTAASDVPAAVAKPVVAGPAPMAPQVPVAPSRPAQERLLLPALDLLTTATHGDWEQTADGALQLDRPQGRLERGLVLLGGGYRIWIFLAGAAQGESRVDGTIGGHPIRTLVVGRRSRNGWYRCEPAPLDLAPGPQVIAFRAQGQGLKIKAMALIGSEALPPAPGVEGWRPHWTDDTGGAPAVAIFDRRFLLGTDVDPFSQNSGLPAGRPGNTLELEESRPDAKQGRELLRIDLHGYDLVDGGLDFVINGERADRDRIQARLIDDAGHQALVASISLTPGAWMAQAIDLRAAAPAGVDEAWPAELDLEDAKDDLSTPFVVGQILVVSHVAPSIDLLALRPPALGPMTTSDLAGVVADIAHTRAWTSPGRTPAGSRLACLCDRRLSDPAWLGSVSTALGRATGVAPDIADFLAMGTTAPGWSKGLFTPRHPLDPARCEILVLIPDELASDTADSLGGRCEEAIQRCLRQGILPVVVGGADLLHRVSGGGNPLWGMTLAAVHQDFPGIPLIDLSPARPMDGNISGAAAAETAAAMIGDGVGEVIERLHRLRRSPR